MSKFIKKWLIHFELFVLLFWGDISWNKDIYKILEYSLLLAIILLDFYDDSKCDCYVVDGKKIFIKKNKYILNLGALIIDLFIKLKNNE